MAYALNVSRHLQKQKKSTKAHTTNNQQEELNLLTVINLSLHTYSATFPEQTSESVWFDQCTQYVPLILNLVPGLAEKRL